jgi:hypothetical protein
MTVRTDSLPGQLRSVAGGLIARARSGFDDRSPGVAELLRLLLLASESAPLRQEEAPP